MVLTEPTDWIGGQLTSQAVPPDEHPWIEQFGRNARYQALRQGIRDYYRRHYPLTAEAAADPFLNPGRGGVSRLCHEPKVALAVLTAMLAPHASAGRLLVLLEHEPVRAEVAGDRVRAVIVRDRKTRDRAHPDRPLLCRRDRAGRPACPWPASSSSIGAEGQAETGEPHAPADPRPDVQQAITCCFAMDYLEGQDHTIDRPAEYDFWRNYVPALVPPWPGKLLDLSYCDPITLKPASRGFDPRGEGKGLWVYRRIADPRNFRSGAFPGSSGITPGELAAERLLAGPAGRAGRDAAAGRCGTSPGPSSSACRSSTGCRPSVPGPMARPAGRGCGCGPTWWAPRMAWPRRLTSASRGGSRPSSPCSSSTSAPKRGGRGSARTDVAAEPFADSVGVGSYRIDLHPSTGGVNYIDISSLPFQIPLGALIPRRVENLCRLARTWAPRTSPTAATGSIPSNGPSARRPARSWHSASQTMLSPRAVRNTPEQLDAFQSRLMAQGVEIDWPRLTPR